MLDISAVKLKDLAEVTEIEFLGQEQTQALSLVRGGESLPIVLDIRGKNFDRVAAVVLNGVELQYIPVTPSRLYAVMPDNMVGQTIRSLNVITDRDSFTNTSLYSFELGSPAPYSGTEKLVFQFIKVLMTTPGTDLFDRSLGGGMRTIAGKAVRDSQSLLAQVIATILNVAEQIRQRDAKLDLPPEETLQSVEIISADFAKGDPTSVSVFIRVRSQSDRSVVFNFLAGVENVLKELIT